MEKWRLVKGRRLFLLVIFLSQICFAGENEKTSPPFAVVELFTSEGCSSCPPADKLLVEIDREARQKKQRVFPIAFHVDYWNNLGWKDPFSHSDFSLRQRRYAQILGVGVYTPQMVVNGQDAFVGSDQTKALQSIEIALSKLARVNLELKAEVKNNSSSLFVRYKVSNASKDQLLHIALVEKELVNKILRGENAGLTLKHENVVRFFKSISLKSADEEKVIELEYGSKILPLKMAIVGYIQDPKGLEILSAAKHDF